MKITASAGTHKGCVRGNNEDNFYINGFYKEKTDEDHCVYSDDKQRSFYTYAISDGIGGAECGELASLYAAEELLKFDGDKLDENIHCYVEAVNKRICDHINENGFKGMGTTLALLFIKGMEAFVCNIGDSRVYLLRENELKQITHDHTRLQSMIDFGLINDEKEKGSYKAHVLTQHLGVFPEEFKLDPFMDRVSAKKDDVFILCSDGLTDMVTDEEIKEILMNNLSRKAEDSVNDLIITAVKNGGTDNVTAVIVKVG